MSFNLEATYLSHMEKILRDGSRQKGRNGFTLSVPFLSLEWDLSNSHLPLITTRQMFPKGILGEYAAMIRGPQHIKDFEKWGCNYWNKWADEDGSIRVDYGNAWIDYNGFNQMEWVLNELKTNPQSRRLLIDAWRPDRLSSLSLPCCHYSYQFWSDGKYLDLLWNQRSADWCIGVPSDILVASVMLCQFASLAELQARTVKMQFGDCHIYAEHIDGAKQQISRNPWNPPKFVLKDQEDLYSFVPDDLKLSEYKYEPSIRYELKA